MEQLEQVEQTLNTTNLLSQKEFAEFLGVVKSYITKLKQNGRLVMIGRKVDKKASLELIEKTKDENRDDVKKRFENERKEKIEDNPSTGPSTGSSTGPSTGSSTGPKTDSNNAANFSRSRSDKMHFDALSAELAFNRESGMLVEKKHVEYLAAKAGASVRNHLERMPDIMAPALATESDQHKIRALMAEQIEDCLTELARTIKRELEEVNL